MSFTASLPQLGQNLAFIDIFKKKFFKLIKYLLEMDCEVCGSKSATVKARISSSVLAVCASCARAGELILEARPTLKKVQPKAEPEEVIVPDFAQRIRLARQRAGLRQHELAERLKEKLSVISALESGRRAPDLKLARKLERFFKIHLIETT